VPGTTELEDRDALSAQLTALGVAGNLVLRDGACRAVALPSLEERAAGCPSRGAPSPDGSVVAQCDGERTGLLASTRGSPQPSVSGCPFAWRPDGVLTVARDGAVVRYRACRGRSCPETLITRRELERAARLHPRFPSVPTRARVLVDGIAWLSSSRAAVLLSIRFGGRAGLGALSEIAFFRDGRLDEDARTYTRMTGGRIAASPRGTYVTQTPDVILRADGSQVSLPSFAAGGSAFAWSPDERFLATATRSAIHVLDVPSLERYDDTAGGLRSVTLPYSSTELAWR
jgi:hypothetical protein